MKQMQSLAFFISSHGYGHAARACAVIELLQRREPSIEAHIFTEVPQWFFDASLLSEFTYHSTWTDIGLVQKNPLQEDPAATLEELGRFLPFAPDRVDTLARKLESLECRLVICDISPLGIAAARTAGLPAVLIENFTWDWIYAAFADEWPAFNDFISYLHEQFASADYHIQTRPVSCPSPTAALTVNPVSRRPRSSRALMRRKLEIPEDAPLVLLSMGGIQHAYQDLGYLQQVRGCCFVVPGAGREEIHRGNLVLLPHHTSYYHPDLVDASDAVIGKAGYSTVAEAFNAGASFGFIPRPRFRESAIMSAFILDTMNGMEISPEEFQSGEWIRALPRLLSPARPVERQENGSLKIAALLQHLLSR
jgi:hypothetical protein